MTAEDIIHLKKKLIPPFKKESKRNHEIRQNLVRVFQEKYE